MRFDMYQSLAVYWLAAFSGHSFGWFAEEYHNIYLSFDPVGIKFLCFEDARDWETARTEKAPLENTVTLISLYFNVKYDAIAV